MSDRSVFDRSEDGLEEKKSWWPDWQAGLALGGSILFVFGLIWGVPRWTHARQVSDLQGAAPMTVPGEVKTLYIAPEFHSGRGNSYAIKLAYANREIYYRLPDASRWLPQVGQRVTVVYRVGRASGEPHIDRVDPITP